MDESPLRVGLAGCGGYGRHLGRDFQAHPDTAVAAVADVDPAAAAMAGRELSVPQADRYTDYDAMLGEADLDAVVIVTPNGLHHEQLLAALDRDLHVFCEKPLATTVDDALAMLDRADDAEETVMVGYQRHLNPAYDLARDRWALGDREPTFITGELTQDWQEYYETMDNWRMDPDLSGGGHLLNVGTHVVDAILWTTGLTPTAVTAQIDFHDDGQVLDKQAAMIVEFAEGAIASIADTGVAARTREHIHVWDGQGAVYLDGREWEQRTGQAIDSEGTEHDPYHGSSRSIPAVFLAAIRGEQAPPATVHDGLRATVVTLAAYESGRQDGERVELADLSPEIDREMLAPR